MSRTHKKQPENGHDPKIFDKKGKILDHRRYRHYYRDMLRHGNYDNIEPPIYKENPSHWNKETID